MTFQRLPSALEECMSPVQRRVFIPQIFGGPERPLGSCHSHRQTSPRRAARLTCAAYPHLGLRAVTELVTAAGVLDPDTAQRPFGCRHRRRYLSTAFRPLPFRSEVAGCSPAAPALVSRPGSVCQVHWPLASSSRRRDAAGGAGAGISLAPCGGSGHTLRAPEACRPCFVLHAVLHERRQCPPLPTRSAITHCSSRCWIDWRLRANSSARRRPHPINIATIA
jgi:hypothetical protein